MKNKKTYISLLIIAAVTIICVAIFNYYHERIALFKYVMSIPTFHNCYPRGIDYVENEDRLYFYLVGYYQKPSCQEAKLEGYDSVYVSKIISNFDFRKYDYIISYMKKISTLKHSPYLTKNQDNLYDIDERIPLIAEYEKGTYDSLFIYRIEKNTEYRAPGP